MDSEDFVQQKINSENFQSIFDAKNTVLENFKTVFKFGIESYISGQWGHAKKFLEKSLALIPNDQPAQVILDYMSKFDYKVPPDWS